MRKFIAVAACAVLLSGCVSARSTMLTESTAEVTARGAHSNDRDEVVYATLEEAAKLTRMHGYRYFVILMAEDASHWGSTNVPGLVLNYNRNARPAGTPIPGLQHLPSATFTATGTASKTAKGTIIGTLIQWSGMRAISSIEFESTPKK